MLNIILLTNLKNYKDFKDRNSKHYLQLMNYLNNNWIKIIRSSIYDYSEEKEYFLRWEFYNWNKWEELTKIKPDKVWYKANTIQYKLLLIKDKYKFFNEPKLITLASNKYDTSNIFKDITPRSYSITEALNIKKETKLIIKPHQWIWWTWIKIISSNEIEKISKLNNDYIIQDFLDLSVWIKWIVEWIHDVRISVFWDEIFGYAYIRTPKEWDFKCNISQGWKDFFIKINDIPKEFINVANNIISYIKKYIWTWFYTIDLCNTNKWVKLMELNSSPWLNFEKHDEREKYYNEIVKYIKYI